MPEIIVMYGPRRGIIYGRVRRQAVARPVPFVDVQRRSCSRASRRCNRPSKPRAALRRHRMLKHHVMLAVIICARPIRGRRGAPVMMAPSEQRRRGGTTGRS